MMCNINDNRIILNRIDLCDSLVCADLECSICEGKVIFIRIGDFDSLHLPGLIRLLFPTCFRLSKTHLPIAHFRC